MAHTWYLSSVTMCLIETDEGKFRCMLGKSKAKTKKEKQHTAGVVDGKIYTIGGLSGPGTPALSTVEEYDPGL